MSARPEEENLSSRVEAKEWWHTIDLPGGLVTPGSWDLRPTAQLVPWPPSMEGARCLDVGTMDGFWAFEMERRGAGDVVATDLADPGEQDSLWRDGVATRNRGQGPPRRGETFRIAADALGSRVAYLDRSVYDLDPEEVGMFDVVFVGYVLQMLRDPLRALEALRSVCGGSLLVVETVSAPLSVLPAPVARLNARRGALEWFVFNRSGLRQALTMAGFEVEAMTRTFRDTAGPAVAQSGISSSLRLRHATGLLGRSVGCEPAPGGRSRPSCACAWGPSP